MNCKSKFCRDYLVQNLMNLRSLNLTQWKFWSQVRLIEDARNFSDFTRCVWKVGPVTKVVRHKITIGISVGPKKRSCNTLKQESIFVIIHHMMFSCVTISTSIATIAVAPHRWPYFKHSAFRHGDSVNVS